MSLEDLGNIGEFVAAVAVLVSLIYLAVQIRQNTKAVRTASYHQAAEQTWSSLLTVAQDPSLAEIMSRANVGQDLPPTDRIRLGALDTSALFGLENMLRLQEEGLIDTAVWHNVLANTMGYLARPRVQEFLRNRPGPLSKRLLEQFTSHSLFSEYQHVDQG